MRTDPLRAAAFLVALVAWGNAQAVERQPLPADFVHDRVILTPSISGRTLRIFTDTGGGWNALSEEVAEELALPVEQVESGDETVPLVAFPDFDAATRIPAPPPLIMGGRLTRVPSKQIFGLDGFLGGRWFADRVWELDYPNQRMALLTGASEAGGDCVPLGFQTAAGERTSHFPSMDIQIAGEVLPVLLDTGATASTTSASAPVFGVEPGEGVGTSFIEHEVFERWQRANPDWRVLENADQKVEQQRRMIEVPEVVIAGHAVGPVWFAEQPPGAFQRYMARWMDRPTWGAIGGSALRYFRVVIDYPRASACFEPAARWMDQPSERTIRP